MSGITQSAFARQIGVSRSYITRLKNEGRLVLTDDGEKVDAAASIARIAETADPNRDDVSARHAAARQTPATENKPAPPAQENKEMGNSYAAARAVKERYAALTAKLGYEQAIGKMVEREAVDAAIEDVMTIVRQSLEQQPHRLAPILVGIELDAIRANLKQEINSVLSEMVREFSTRMKQITGEEV